MKILYRILMSLLLTLSPAAMLTANTLTVTNGADAGIGSLRSTLLSAESAGDTIIFLPSVTTVSLTSEAISVSKDVTIIGTPRGVTVRRASGVFRIFTIGAGFTVTMERLIITDGNSELLGGGGGILNDGTLRLVECAVLNNTAAANNGGGIFTAANRSLTLDRCLVAGNTGSAGGGFFCDAGSQLTLTNTTVTDNTASLAGGAINFTGSASLLTHCTVSHNSAVSSGGGLFGNLTLKSTIVSNNTAPAAPDISGTVTSEGWNYLPVGTSITGDDIGNILGSTPNLGELQNNGGLSATRALLTGSPCIDAGRPLDSLRIDQRRQPRPTSGTVANAVARITINDIGAYEAPPALATWTPAPLSPATAQTLNGVSNNVLGRFIAVGDSGKIYASSTGFAWAGLTPNYTAAPLNFPSAPRLTSIAVEADFSPVIAIDTVPVGLRSAAFGTAISCGVGGTILRTTDGGATFVRPNSVPASLGANDLLDVALPSIIGGIMPTERASTQTGNSPQTTAAFGTAISCGVGGTILRTLNGGADWTDIAPNYAALGLGSLPELRAVAVSNDFAVAARTQNQTGNSVQAPAAFGTAISCGVGGTILRSTDGGETWALAASSTTQTLNDVAIVNTPTAFQKGAGAAQSPAAFGTAISCGVGGTVLRSTDGAVWQNISANLNAALDLTTVVAVSSDTWFVAGASGAVFKTTNFGDTWENLSIGAGASINGLAVLPNGTAVAVGNGGTIFGSPNGGGGNTPVPVEFSSLSASQQGDRIALRWTTASEKNNAGFEVERSFAESSVWEKIGFVKGNGTTTEQKSYSFTDNALPSGTASLTGDGRIRYRLKQTDFDGKFAYSPEVEVRLGVPERFRLGQNYPNPFNPETTIAYTLGAATDVSLKVFDVLGREVRTLVNERQSAGNYSIRFNAAGLASGIYFYRLETRPANSVSSSNSVSSASSVYSSASSQAVNFKETKKMMLIK